MQPDKYQLNPDETGMPADEIERKQITCCNFNKALLNFCYEKYIIVMLVLTNASFVQRSVYAAREMGSQRGAIYEEWQSLRLHD